MGLKPLYTICSVDLLIIGLVAPLYRPYSIKLGASELQIGALESACSLLSFITGPIAGSLSDTKGRKFIIAATLLLNMISYLVIGLTNTLVPFMAGRILSAISNKVQIVAKAFMADLVPKEEQSDCFAKLGILRAVGFIIGPVLGGYMYQATEDLSLISMVVTVIVLLSLGLLVLLPNDNVKNEVRNVDMLQTLKDTFANFTKINWTVFGDIFSIKLLFEACFMMFYLSLGVTLSEFGASQVVIGYIFALHTILLILGNLVINKIKNKFYKNDKTGLDQNLHGFIVLTATYIGFFMSSNFETYVTFVIPLSLIRVLFDSVHMDVLLSKTPEDEKGVIMGAFESVMPFAGFLMPLLAGIAGQFWGGNALRFAGVPVAALGVLLVYVLKRKEMKNK